MLVEVDVISRHATYGALCNQLTDRFHFGEWDENEAEYAGRRIRCTENRIYVDQSECFIEQVQPIQLPKRRRSNKDPPLNKEEFNALRSLVYKSTGLHVSLVLRPQDPRSWPASCSVPRERTVRS